MECQMGGSMPQNVRDCKQCARNPAETNIKFAIKLKQIYND
jgi:hypothetical protein